jgi:hypothetical protein
MDVMFWQHAFIALSVVALIGGLGWGASYTHQHQGDGSRRALQGRPGAAPLAKDRADADAPPNASD